MFRNKRKLKRRTKKFKGIGWLILFLSLVAFFAVGWYYLSGIIVQKPLYVSPVSSVKAFNVPSQTERNIIIVKELLREKQISYTSVTGSDSTITITLKQEETITVSQSKSIPEQISSLQFILSRLTMEGKLMKTLDLRFDKPVVVLQQ